MNDGVTDRITHVVQAAGTNDQHGNDQTNDGHGGVVGLRIAFSQMMTQPPGEAESVEELPEEFESAVGGGPVAGETEGKIPLDRSADKAFSMSHRECPFGSSKDLSRQLFLYDRKPLSARQKAGSFESTAFFFNSVLTNWG
jgi:hypothetical protein